jgi:NADP-dependent 3-hydroxy acid dehydrogenase YdfG
MSGSLAGRTALVTGASSGIGEGIAGALAAAGATVAVSARRVDRLAELVGRIEAAGGRAIALPGDMADEKAAADVVEETVRRLGRLDILVNSAGVIQVGGVEDANIAEWRRVIEINLMSILYTCRAAIGPMKAQGGGDIINITSTAGRRAGNAHFGPYATSKVAATTLTEGLRQEVGGYGIRVCNIEPGAVTSEVAEGISDPKVKDAIRQHVTKDGAMKPEDIGAIVLFVVTLPPSANVSEILVRPTIDTLPL